MKWILSGLIALLSACSTAGNTSALVSLKDGYTPKFKDGDCANLDPESDFVKKHPIGSDGTPVEIIYIDTKYGGYITYMDHPRFNRPTVRGAEIKRFDKNWMKVKCE